MVQINSFFRQTHNTMATMASLFMLLTVTFSCIQAATHDPPEVLPQFPQARPATHLPDLQDVMGKIKESCPPFGSPDERFKVTVLGTLSPPIGGCASMQTVHHDIVPAFNLWLGSLRYGGGSCDEEGMDHYMFECLSKHPFIEDDNIKGWYVTLYDQTARWSGQKDYRCGLYSMLNDDPPMIQMVIGANRSCDGLSRRMGTVEHRVPDGFRHFEDGSVALLFSKDWPQPISSVDVWRKKRSASQGRTYRFPDWSQGSWLDLQVNGSLIHYDTNYHEKDDVDYDQDNDDEKNGDAEISSGEQYMQRSQQYDPVGMSSRNRRSVPNMNGVKMFRTRTITILNNTKDIDWLKRQLLNDNMRILDEFNLQRERRSVEPKKPKFVLDVLSQTLPELFPTNEFEYGGNYTTKTEEKNKTTNVNDYFSKIQKDSEALNKIFNSVFGIGNVRHKRDLSNQREYVEHGEENSKPRKKRCFGSSAKTTTTERYRDLWFENPPKKGDPMEPFDKTNKYFGTTQNPGGRTMRKRRFVDENLDNKSKNIDYEEEKQLERVKELEKAESLIRWWKVMQDLSLIDPHIWDQSNAEVKKTEYKVFPDTSMTQIKRSFKNERIHSQENTNHKNKKCNYKKDLEVFTSKKIEDLKPLFYNNKFSLKNKITTEIRKDLEPLNEIFNSVFGISNIRHKRDLSNQREYVEHGKESSKPRKKRCFGSSAKTSTTARYRDPEFENPPKKGDPMEPFDKTNKYFGTTQNPGGRTIRKGRSVDEDSYNKSKNTNYEKEKQLEKVNEIEKVRSLIRWWNLMRVLPLIEHRIWNQSNTDTKKTEYEVFPDTSMTPVPSPVKYLEFAKILGIPYKEAVLKWRSLERKYRQREAEVDYTAYPGQNHPDIVMRDFDQTFDGIEYDFNPLYPEGTVDDPTAYRVLTLPGGYRIEPRLSRRTTFAEKQLGATSESVKVDSDFQYIQSNSLNDGLNTLMPKRIKRSSTLPNQQQRATTKFTWNCIMPVDNDEKQPHNLESGAKFLVYGGRIMEKTNENSNNQPEPNLDTLFDSKKDSKMTYGCLWLVPRGPNIIEFSIIGTGLPDKEQNIQSFAKQLCTEKKSVSKDSNIRNKKKLLPRRHLWVTETRADEAKRVPVGCPIPPGTVFYGEIPAPPPSSTVTNNSQSVLPRLCVKLISSADDCTNGRAGAIDQMKYTVSECVERDASTGTSLQTMTAQQTIFEASRGYTVGGSWRRNKRHSAPIDTSTVASSVSTTSISSNTPTLPDHSISTEMTDEITSHQTTGSTTTSSTAMTSSSTYLDSSNSSQNFVDTTTIQPKTINTTITTATTFLTAMPSTLPFSPQQTTYPERQLPSFSTTSASTTSTTTASTTTTTSPPPPSSFTTSTTNYPVTDYHYRQQQQHQQSNYNNNDYYYRGRQQHYPPPPPGSTSTDYNYYYQQRQQQHPQMQSYWPSQQHLNGTNDYSNGYQQQTTDSGGRRTSDYYYRQQQQNSYNHQYNNDRQQQTPRPRDASLPVQHPSGGSWNVHGDRPLYISSSGGGGDYNREIFAVARNSSTGISSSNNGGWATAEQQHWWYQQQQQQQRQQEQQNQYQQRQQQNNRGLSGILSLPPVPLPPLHVEQGAVTVSMSTSPPLHLRRPQKPPNHYYLPTLTTKTTSTHPYRLRSKSESRYYEEREYKCLGQWTEPQQHINPEVGEKAIMLTYIYVKRLNPIANNTDQFECFVGTIIPNDEGSNPETTKTLLLTEAGSGTLCSRRSDPYRSGMKLVGTKINKEGACKGSEQPAQDIAGGSWYPLKPQPISPSIPSAENSGGTWYAAPPVPVVAQGPTTMMPILTGRHTGGNGALFTSRQNERRPQSATPPPKTNDGNQNLSDNNVMLLVIILFIGHLQFITHRYF
ncbi:uncharacterized protein LOC112595758 isoform X2 [Melanaphis sacchari]|uniref:uncharacterized protein LOC112595758 isoform X2 n=1 Tax=Melanaphis sacchari TaxID=742174 RepID=UPI000DC14519|nr:uncharacterized protein LOC112595758 isoform X2 [Melanaphis sacchari]